MLLMGTGIRRVAGWPGVNVDMKSNEQRWRDGIAIVGMSARFPGCRSVGEYWEKIVAGVSLLSEPTDGELRAAGVDPELVRAGFVRSGTVLEEAENFDAKFFDLSHREAEIMDPQQRILLECAYEALEHAGSTGDGAKVGIFAGVGMNTYMMQLLGNPELLAAAGGYQLMLGNDKDFLATRVAYKLNLRGPAVVVQTACSTSLAAVHLACQSLLCGECDSALAGGVSVSFPQVAAYPYIPGMILSPDGFCRPFDERAQGTVPGRGAGIVVLKRLADAVADGDTIYAVIAGSAWNNDGSEKVGYTAPSVAGQAEVIRGAYAAAGITPDRIGYVEAHGTGTELGDPIEVAALAEVFGERAADAARCVLGAVKANMGHADVAAGVAGLIKAALAVHHGVIPPTPHFERANPALGLERTPFLVSAERAEWPEGEREHWAGVSSFGIGGTNVHVCLRSAPVAVETESAIGPWVFPLSAKTERALEASAGRLADFVTTSGDLPLAAVAATLQTGRRAYGNRRAVVAGSGEELTAALGKLRKTGFGALSGSGDVVFLFPGQGLQFAGMAAALYERDDRFRERIVRGLACLPSELAERVLAAICGTESSEDGEARVAMDTGVAQPLLFLVEYALAERWIGLGVIPSVLLGHSLGELTAAAVARVFSFEDGLRLAAERGRLMQETPEGAMLAVSLSADEVGRELTLDLWIAAENAPKLTVISGSVRAIEEAELRFKKARVATARLATDRAFHTPDMAEAATKFQAAVAKVERNAPRLRWLSNVSGTWITADEATSPQYWADQMTARVRFSENAAVLAKPGAEFPYFLLEVGPGDALATLVRQQDRGGIKASSTASSLGGVQRRGDDFGAFLEAAARLWERGADLRWEQLPGYVAGERRQIALPTYPFERERLFVEATQPLGGATQGSDAAKSERNRIEKRSDIGSWFYAPTWQKTPPVGMVLQRPAEAIATWIVLGNAGNAGPDGYSFAGLAERIAAGLEDAGARVLRITGMPASRDELESFWKEHQGLTAAGPVGLVSGWGLRGAGNEPGLDVYGSLLWLLQTAVKARVRFAQMEFVIDELAEVNGESVEDSGRALVEGMARILPAEFAGTATRVIDPGRLSPGRLNAEVLDGAARLVLAEIGTVASACLTVAFRGGTRWQQVWLPVRLEAAEQSRFRVGGAYVITGGMGGIGFTLARHLLQKYGAKVALLGRTVLPHRERWEEWLTERGPLDATSRRIQRAQELERLGGELLLLSADVTERASMERAWTVIEERFGPVHGVIHAAGLPGGDRIVAESLESVASTLGPKVQGSEVLVELLAGRVRAGQVREGQRIDFLLFCSSISAVVPVAGATTYAAANAFQDRYATWCRQHLGLPALAVNFDAWQEVGMAAERDSPAEFEHLKQARLQTAMSLDEGVEVVERVLACGLASDLAQILVSTVDFTAIMRGALAGVGSEAAERFQPGDSSGEFAEAAETRAVMAIWRELLGAELIEPGDNFFALGGHSLLGTMVLARIREQFGVDLGIRAIFEAPTPELLGLRIRQAEPADAGATPVAAGGEREEFEI
jgi:phthiocerol/phenolphthiocerol synthesis type-I polyketide synthase E